MKSSLDNKNPKGVDHLLKALDYAGILIDFDEKQSSSDEVAIYLLDKRKIIFHKDKPSVRDLKHQSWYVLQHSKMWKYDDTKSRTIYPWKKEFEDFINASGIDANKLTETYKELGYDTTKILFRLEAEAAANVYSPEQIADFITQCVNENETLNKEDAQRDDLSPKIDIQIKNFLKNLGINKVLTNFGNTRSEQLERIFYLIWSFLIFPSIILRESSFGYSFWDLLVNYFVTVGVGFLTTFLILGISKNVYGWIRKKYNRKKNEALKTIKAYLCKVNISMGRLNEDELVIHTFEAQRYPTYKREFHLLAIRIRQIAKTEKTTSTYWSQFNPEKASAWLSLSNDFLADNFEILFSKTPEQWLDFLRKRQKIDYSELMDI